MRYTRTQVYLDPSDHQALKRQAGKKDVSMAELVREIVADYLAGDTADRPFTKDEYMSIVGLGESQDDAHGARDHDRHLGDAMADEHAG